MKSILAALLFVLFTFCLPTLKAQVDNYDEIVNFVDSTEIRIVQGRKFLTNAVKNRDKNSIRKGIDFLLLESGGNYNRSMNFYEYYSLCILAGSYTDGLDAVQGYGTDLYPSKYPDDLLSFNIHQALTQTYGDIESDIEKNITDSEEQYVLKAVLEYLASENDISDEKREANKAFVKNNPDSPYAAFVEQYLPLTRVTGGTYLAFGAAMFQPAGDYSDYFDLGWGGMFSWELLFNQVYVSLYLHGGTVHPNTSFTLTDSEGTYTFGPKDNFSYFSGGLDIGYDVFKNRNIMVAPAVSIMGGSLQSMLYEDVEIPEYYFFNSFIYGLNVNVAFKFYEFKSPMWQGGYLGLKLKAAREWPVSGMVKHQLNSGVNVFECALVFGGGDL